MSSLWPVATGLFSTRAACYCEGKIREGLLYKVDRNNIVDPLVIVRPKSIVEGCNPYSKGKDWNVSLF